MVPFFGWGSFDSRLEPLMVPFFGWGSSDSRLQPLRGGYVIFYFYPIGVFEYFK